MLFKSILKFQISKNMSKIKKKSENKGFGRLTQQNKEMVYIN